MQARYMATELDRLNQQRRTIESEMKEEAEAAIAAVSVNASSLPAGLVVYQKDFHQGVIGIVAGRIKDKYKRPTIAFAHQDEDTIKGSARSVNGVHIRDVLEEVNTRQPGLIPKFGGHAMAAGLSLPLTSLTVFQQTFDDVVATHLARVGDLQRIVTDGALHVDEMSLSVARLLKQAVPFGQGFEAPAFDGVFEIASQRLLKEKHLKLALKLDSGEEVDAIAFNVDTSVWPNYQTRYVQLVYQLEVNAFRGQETVQLMVQEIAPYEH